MRTCFFRERRLVGVVAALALGTTGLFLPLSAMNAATRTFANIAGTDNDAVATTASSADSRPRRIVAGWIRPAPYQTDALTSLRANADLWSEVSPFWFSASGPTTVSGKNDETVVTELRRLGLRVVPTVVETLNTPQMEALLADSTKRKALAATIGRLVKDNGYDGVDLDFEAMNFGGTVAQKRHVAGLFVTFLKDIRANLGAGKALTTAVGPRTSPSDSNWLVHDYAQVGAAVDRLRLMTYDNHYRGGQPGAIAPLPWVKSVLAYAVTVVPRGKVELGVPLYGYDWPQKANGTYGTATSLGTYALVEALRTKVKAPRQYSSVDAAPFFTYTDASGTRHQVWYNDSASTRAKMTLVGAYGIRGLAFWHVSGEDSRQWPALRSYAVQRGTTVTASGPAAVTYGAAATFSGTVRATTSGATLKGIAVRLQDRALGAQTWATRATVSTSGTGTVSFATKPGTNREYRLVTGATWTYRAGNSPTLRTMVRWRVTAKLGDSAVRRGDQITLRGTVGPARAGTVVQRQRLVAGTWTTVASGKTGSTGAYAFTFTWRTAGSYTYRVRVPGTKYNATGASRALTVKVS